LNSANILHIFIELFDNQHVSNERAGRNAAKPFMLDCPLFCEFHKPNKTMKLKGTNINYIATLTTLMCRNYGITCRPAEMTFPPLPQQS